MGLYPLLARAAAIAENENSSFAEALSLAAAERGTPLRRVFADEAEALSHDLGHGGAAEQRAVIDLDNGRIRLEYDHRAGSLRESLDALANHFPTAGANRIQNRLIAFLAEHDGSEELYKTLHNELGLTNQEIEAMGFDLAHRYEPDCDDAYQDIVDYIRFEQETSKMWPWLISGDEMLAQETTLREIAGRLTAAGEWDTESIYESLTEAFGNNLSLDKQSKDDTKEEERNINIKQDQLDLLWQLEEFRKKHEHQAEPSDWAIRMCEAFVARSMGFTDRVQWTELLRQKGETLFTFDWKSGSVSDHVVQWCKENNRNWRYSHLGELQVAHGGEWRKVDYFCRDGSETRVYFPPEPVQEQQLHALAEAPAVHLRDLLTLGLPDHDVYLRSKPMTSIDFLNKVHKILDSQEYNLSYSPAKSKNYMLYCNGNFIGGLFDEELCFVYADSVSELLGHPEPVYRGYSSTAQHRMLVIPEEHWSKALKLLYAEKFDWSRLVYDITYTSIGAAVVEDFYDENVVFLRFCFEKELLKKNPLDRQGRILRMVYLNQDLTKAGKYLFPRLMQKFLVFTDRNGKTSLETMLKRWYTQLEKEYRNQTAG